MSKSFQHKLRDALRLQSIVFMLYLLFMATFSEHPVLATLPLDLSFGIGIFVMTGFIVYIGTIGANRQTLPCHNCPQRGFCAYIECPQRSAAHLNQHEE